MSDHTSPTLFELLSAPHVQRGILIEMLLPGNTLRLHTGIGRVVVGGTEWTGVTDPLGGRLISFSEIEEPRFGKAPLTKITLSGANTEFLKSVHATRADIEGSKVTIYYAIMDTETGHVVEPLHAVFRGRLTSPEIHWEAIGTRTVSVGAESRWSGQNYTMIGLWSNTAQRKKFPNDKGLDRLGIDVSEKFN